VRTPERKALMEALAERGVQTGIHYPTPIHLLPSYADLNYRAGDFPVAEQIAREELSLPLFPEMTAAQIAEVSQAVLEHQNAYQY